MRIINYYLFEAWLYSEVPKKRVKVGIYRHPANREKSRNTIIMWKLEMVKIVPFPLRTTLQVLLFLEYQAQWDPLMSYFYYLSFLLGFWRVVAMPRVLGWWNTRVQNFPYIVWEFWSTATRKLICCVPGIIWRGELGWAGSPFPGAKISSA